MTKNHCPTSVKILFNSWLYLEQTHPFLLILFLPEVLCCPSPPPGEDAPSEQPSAPTLSLSPVVGLSLSSVPITLRLSRQPRRQLASETRVASITAAFTSRHVTSRGAAGFSPVSFRSNPDTSSSAMLSHLCSVSPVGVSAVTIRSGCGGYLKKEQTPLSTGSASAAALCRCLLCSPRFDIQQRIPSFLTSDRFTSFCQTASDSS